MKQLLFAFAVLCAFCSCAKNYTQLVEERAAQYEKEGKVILAKSEDETGKEHYVIYGDPKAQTLGVDTLGDDVTVIPLGKQKYVNITPVAYNGKGLQFINDDDDYYTWDEDVTINDKGELMFTNDDKEKQKFDKVEFYKGKYVLMCNTSSKYTADNHSLAIFFKKPSKYRICGIPNIEKDGNMTVSIHTTLPDICNKDYGDFYNEGDDIYVDRDHEDFCIKVTISPDEEVTPASYGIASTIEFPVEAFASWATLRGYLAKIALIELDAAALDW